MIKSFHSLKERIVTDVISFTESQFADLICFERPKGIFNGVWSSSTPFIVITEYNEFGLKMYCNGLTDKTPEQKTIKELYNFLKYQGLSESYIVVED